MSGARKKRDSTPRRTLATYGARGDQVRVLVDARADRVEVKYRDAEGVARKRIFANDKAGRAAAVAWGSTYHAARAAEQQRAAELAAGVASVPARVTVRGLWEAYVASPAFANLRRKTQDNYTTRYRTWQRFRGDDALADDTTLHHVDRFRTSMREAGRAPNSARQVLSVVRAVMNWGQTRELVRTNKIALHRWKTKKGEEPLEPEEYTEAEFLTLLGAVSPQSGRTWRLHVALMLVGHHGQRANAIRHLRWADVDWAAGEIVWPAEYQKNGCELIQPLTDEGRAALFTAWYWRERTGYEGPWVLFAGGGNKRLGDAPLPNWSRRRARTADQDVPMTYGGLWAALTKAEERAGVEHKERRAFHGGRKMSAGNVADRTGDDRLGMEWIGDKDMKQAKKYLKRRNERFARAAAAASTAPVPAPAPPAPSAPAARKRAEPQTESVPEVSLPAPTTNAPAVAEALALDPEA